MRALAIVLLAFGAVHCSAPASEDAEMSAPAINERIDAASWMQTLPSTTNLAALSIPGTHESCARHEPLPHTAKCQDLSLAEQLDAGIRYLDVRCRHFHDHFEIHHALVYQEMNFDDVLDQVIPFLESHGSETVMMSIKEEYTADGNTRSFEDTFATYIAKNPSRWLLDDTVPSLEDARGKIVLVRRFKATKKLGIAAQPWADKATFSIDNAAHVRVQDSYEVKDNAVKWTAITSLFDEATKGDSTTLFLDYTSGFKPELFGIPNVNKVSDAMNPKLESYFAKAPKGRYGVVAMDFADDKLASSVFEKNFR